MKVVVVKVVEEKEEACAFLLRSGPAESGR